MDWMNSEQASCNQRDSFVRNKIHCDKPNQTSRGSMQNQIHQMECPRRCGQDMSGKPVSEKKHRPVIVRTRRVAGETPDVGVENTLQAGPDAEMGISLDGPVIVVDELISQRGNVKEDGQNNGQQWKPPPHPL